MAPDLVGRRVRDGFGLMAGTCCEDEKGCRPQHNAGGSLQVFPLNSHTRSSLRNRCDYRIILSLQAQNHQYGLIDCRGVTRYPRGNLRT